MFARFHATPLTVSGIHLFTRNLSDASINKDKIYANLIDANPQKNIFADH